MSSMSMDFATLGNNILSVEKMWDIKNYDKEQGIGSYKVPPLNIECKKQKEDRERRKMIDKFLKGKAEMPQSRKNYNKEGDEILPQRGSYFDDLAKLNDYGFDEKKEDKIKNFYSGHNRKFIQKKDVINSVVVNKDSKKSPLYKSEKDHYTDEIEINEKKNSIHHPHLENCLIKIKDKIEKDKSSNMKLSAEMIKEKYHKRGSMS